MVKGGSDGGDDENSGEGISKDFSEGDDEGNGQVL